MTLKSQSILLFLTLLLSFAFADIAPAAGGRKGLVGGWKRIDNLNAPEVQDAAQFAVTEHNKEANTKLKYQSVVRGETQVVAGTNYRLVIAAKDGDTSGNYEAVVWVKPWEHYRNLTSFKKL